MLYRVVWLTIILMVAPLIASAQVRTWWNVDSDETTETGKIQEIKEKKRVYVTVNYRSTDPDQVSAQHERDLIRRSVVQAIGTYNGLEIVLTPERAELAITVNSADSNVLSTAVAPGNFSAALDPNAQTPLEVVVLVRGAMQRDGGYRPRVVWELSTPNVRGEPAPAAGFFMDAFIGQLKKVRGETKK